jgi:hypothetical protein
MNALRFSGGGNRDTTLRPSGKARFGDHVVDVATQGEFTSGLRLQSFKPTECASW